MARELNGTERKGPQCGDQFRSYSMSGFGEWPTRAGLVAIMTIFLGVVFTACGSSQPSAQGSKVASSQANAKTCRASDNLRLSIVSDGTAAGTEYLKGNITISGVHTCAIRGYPSINLLDESGKPLVSKEVHYSPESGPGVSIRTKPERVILRRGSKASFLVAMGDGSALPHLPNCPALSKLRVTLPERPSSPFVETISALAGAGPIVAYPSRPGGQCNQVYVSSIYSAGRSEHS